VKRVPHQEAGIGRRGHRHFVLLAEVALDDRRIARDTLSLDALRPAHQQRTQIETECKTMIAREIEGDPAHRRPHVEGDAVGPRLP